MRNIASERVRICLTQDGLAEHLGTTRETVNRWETGANLPAISSLLKMADLFGCSVDYLLGRTDVR